MSYCRQHHWVLFFLLAGATLLSSCAKAPAAHEQLRPVRSAVVEVSRPQTAMRFSASVLPAAQVDVAFRVGGYVQSICQSRDPDGHWRAIDTGDQVQAGVVLASIRPTDYQSRSDALKNQLTEARSGAATAQAQLDDATAARALAQTNFARAKVLFESQALIKPDYDEARVTLDRAQAQVTANEAEYAARQARIEEVAATKREADSSLTDTELRAPFSGVIVSRKVEAGSLASPGTVAFTVADLRNVKVAFGVPDLTLSSFRLGQVVPVITESVPGSVFTGRISTISPSADPSSRIYTIQVAVPNPAGLLKAGMIAAIHWNGERPETPAPLVPLSAVVHTASTDGYGVFVLESKNGATTTRFRTIRLGHLTGTQVAVLQGLTAGEHIAEDGGLQLFDGDIVREIR